MEYNDCFVQSYGWYEDDEWIFIAMEYFPYGDLQGFMASGLVEADVREIARQVLEGLVYMHGNGFTHRDLNPRVSIALIYTYSSTVLNKQNILVRSPGPEWWVKIGDFGISKRSVEDGTVLRTFTGTQGFMAPEILVKAGHFDCENTNDYSDYSFGVDIWSLGEIVFRALTKRAPFPYPRDLGAYIKGNMVFPEDQLRARKVSPMSCDFVEELLRPKPKERPTASTALNHPWLRLASNKRQSSFKGLPSSNEVSSDQHYETSGNSSGVSRSEGPITMTQPASPGRPWTLQDTGRWTDLEEDNNKTISKPWVQASSLSGSALSPYQSSITSREEQQTSSTDIEKQPEEQDFQRDEEDLREIGFNAMQIAEKRKNILERESMQTNFETHENKNKSEQIRENLEPRFHATGTLQANERSTQEGQDSKNLILRSTEDNLDDLGSRTQQQIDNKRKQRLTQMPRLTGTEPQSEESGNAIQEQAETDSERSNIDAIGRAFRSQNLSICLDFEEAQDRHAVKIFGLSITNPSIYMKRLSFTSLDASQTVHYYVLGTMHKMPKEWKVTKQGLTHGGFIYTVTNKDGFKYVFNIILMRNFSFDSPWYLDFETKDRKAWKSDISPYLPRFEKLFYSIEGISKSEWLQSKYFSK